MGQSIWQLLRVVRLVAVGLLHIGCSLLRTSSAHTLSEVIWDLSKSIDDFSCEDTSNFEKDNLLCRSRLLEGGGPEGKDLIRVRFAFEKRFPLLSTCDVTAGVGADELRRKVLETEHAEGISVVTMKIVSFFAMSALPLPTLSRVGMGADDVRWKALETERAERL